MWEYDHILAPTPGFLLLLWHFLFVVTRSPKRKTHTAPTPSPTPSPTFAPTPAPTPNPTQSPYPPSHSEVYQVTDTRTGCPGGLAAGQPLLTKVGKKHRISFFEDSVFLPKAITLTTRHAVLQNIFPVEMHITLPGLSHRPHHQELSGRPLICVDLFCHMFGFCVFKGRADACVFKGRPTQFFVVLSLRSEAGWRDR